MIPIAVPVARVSSCASKACIDEVGERFAAILRYRPWMDPIWRLHSKKSLEDYRNGAHCLWVEPGAQIAPPNKPPDIGLFPIDISYPPFASLNGVSGDVLL